MKSYPPEKNYSSRWLAGQHYVHSSDALSGGILGALYEPVEKYPNPLFLPEVQYICYHFHPFDFSSITINKESELTDGQHRLTVANYFGWEYIDVWVEKDLNEQS